MSVRKARVLMAMGLAAATAGCGFGLSIFLPSTVTLTFVNEIGDFDINGKVAFDNRDALLPADLIGFGESRSFSVAGGGSTSIGPLRCGDVESLVLYEAELQVIGGIGPDTNTGILRIDEDYDCGDEIVFTFTGNVLDLDVTTSARP